MEYKKINWKKEKVFDLEIFPDKLKRCKLFVEKTFSKNLNCKMLNREQKLNISSDR